MAAAAAARPREQGFQTRPSARSKEATQAAAAAAAASTHGRRLPAHRSWQLLPAFVIIGSGVMDGGDLLLLLLLLLVVMVVMLADEEEKEELGWKKKKKKTDDNYSKVRRWLLRKAD